jgi:hypothetical protein
MVLAKVGRIKCHRLNGIKQKAQKITRVHMLGVLNILDLMLLIPTLHIDGIILFLEILDSVMLKITSGSCYGGAYESLY